MRVFIYEYVTGGGLQRVGKALVALEALEEVSLVVQGAAMARAITADFCELPGVTVLATRDCRLPELHSPPCEVMVVESASDNEAALARLGREADWTLVIAPETGGELARCARLVESVGGRLLSPGSRTVAIAADKQATAELLASRKIPVPRGIVVSTIATARSTELGYPIVIKPVDGCGSDSVRLIREETELVEGLFTGPVRMEAFVPGIAASVSVLCGPAGNTTLPASQQILSGDGRFAYRGGRLPLAADLDRRAQRLAAAAAATLPDVWGYIGVDLVLGNAVDGSEDAVIEINPRLTTSYVGLRALSRTNLAGAMLAIADGQPGDLSFGLETVKFAADGTIAQNLAPVSEPGLAVKNRKHH